MTPESNGHLGSFLDLMSDRGFQSEIAQIRTQALLLRLTHDIPAFRWSVRPARVIRNASGASVDLHQLAALTPLDPDSKETSGALRLAQLWESLAELGEGATLEFALMNAAMAYDIAGYQANASYLAKRLVPDTPELSFPSLIELVATFVRRRFIRVIDRSQPLIGQPTLRPGDSDQLTEATATALLSAGIMSAARYFLSGNEEVLDRSRRQLELARMGFGNVGLTIQYDLAGMIGTLLPVMKARSVWTELSGNKDQRWQRYLRLVARGQGRDIYNSISLAELWPSQLLAIQQGLLQGSESLMVKLPTSAGKTRVAELAIANALITTPGSKCVYVAPYRALVTELLEGFASLFTDLGFRVAAALGSYETDSFEQELLDETDLLITTPEKLDLLQRINPELLARVSLVVIDEGQILEDQTRGARFELLLTRLSRRQPDLRYLFLSAVVPEESLEEIASWLSRGNAKMVTSTWRPAIQRLARFEWNGELGVLRYVPDVDIQANRRVRSRCNLSTKLRVHQS
jgi:helicase